MARYVVLSFDPNEDAEAFIDDWFKHKDEDGFAKLTTADGRVVEAEVMGLYAQALQFCSGEFAHKDEGVGLARTVYGRKYGWWVCSVCHKRRGKWMPPRLVGEGRNLFKEYLDKLKNPPQLEEEVSDDTSSQAD